MSARARRIAVGLAAAFGVFAGLVFFVGWSARPRMLHFRRYTSPPSASGTRFTLAYPEGFTCIPNYRGTLVYFVREPTSAQFIGSRLGLPTDSPDERIQVDLLPVRSAEDRGWTRSGSYVAHSETFTENRTRRRYRLTHLGEARCEDRVRQIDRAVVLSFRLLRPGEPAPRG